jgi:hypothetical protein
MSSRDDDIIEFDFFDEPPTVEQQSTQRVRMPRRRRGEEGPPRPPIRPPQGFTPLLRLIGLIAFAILIVVLLVFWVQSCRGASKRNAYRSYMQNVGRIAQGSEAVGHDLTDALTTPGIKVADLEKRLDALAQREQQDVAKAKDLTPPGALRPEHQAVIESLQFRVSGLQGLAATFRRPNSTKAGTNAADLLAQQSQRFVASDVVWADRFKEPAIAELQRQGISGIAPPSSAFVTDPELATPAAWENGSSGILPRLRGASTGGTPGGGPHGTALEFVKTLPSGKTLSQSETNTVEATTDLAFSVGVKDSGNAQEVGIQVTLTIQKSTGPIVKTQTIRVIDPGQVKTVVFRNLGQVPFGTKTTLKVDIAPVPSEANAKNNSGSYPVVFSLAG